MPRHDPLKPTMAPSPPDDPPEVNVVLKGFVVVLWDSAICYSGVFNTSNPPVQITSSLQMH
jgi:hypothetical protein